MTTKQHTKTTCNPFRYLDLWNLEALARQANEMEPETKALVLEAVMEKRASVAEESAEYLVWHRHTDFVKHSL